jgi:salicylate hydroxylase
MFQSHVCRDKREVVLTFSRIGDRCHVMTYTIAGGNSFNMVLSHVDHTDPVTWSQNSNIDNMRKEFAGWDPR